MAALLCAACDENTGTIGLSSDDDAIVATASSFYFSTRTIMLDSVVANSSKCYLGRIHDWQTDTDVKAEFAAQFHCFENYKLPGRDKMHKGADGDVVADSVEIRFYFNNYFGEPGNPIKVSVYELDTANVISEDKTYYSNLDLTQYLPANAKPIVTKMFSAEDYTLEDDVRTSTTHNANVRFVLPAEYGTRILRQGLNNPTVFKDSWQFIHHSCPGFYFKLDGGSGTMLTLDVGALNIYFTYDEGDSTFVGLTRFAATPEVIQHTNINNTGLSLLIDDEADFTYLKSPAGLCTEVTLPVDNIYKGHDTDSVSLARMVLTRINNTWESEYNMNMASGLLLVRKQNMDSFFGQHKVADGLTSFVTTFNSNYNTYTFNNISRLIAFCHAEKRRIMREEGLTSEAFNAAYPDWNKAVLVPVDIRTTTDAATNASVVVSVTHDFNMTSTKLVGGTKPLPLQIIYSTYR